ncbi:MAG: large conductance mechanosensitive channel protein MscL [Tatlockia sp.]|nr:large conductance mechanosensitive channel protein MscL [Tatlockia sp.]
MKLLSEFKQFAMRGNAMDLAVAVVIGAAFGKIISSFVEGLVMPLISVLLGGINIASISFKIGAAVFKWGSFLQSIIDFVIIALAIFIAIKFINVLRRRRENAPEKLSMEQSLLVEIRDLLKATIAE